MIEDETKDRMAFFFLSNGRFDFFMNSFQHLNTANHNIFTSTLSVYRDVLTVSSFRRHLFTVANSLVERVLCLFSIYRNGDNVLIRVLLIHHVLLFPNRCSFTPLLFDACRRRFQIDSST